MFLLSPYKYEVYNKMSSFSSSFLEKDSHLSNSEDFVFY